MEVVAIGGSGCTNSFCQHLPSDLGVEYIKDVHEQDGKTTLLLKQYCKCGVRLYGTYEMQSGDKPEMHGDLIVLVRAKT